MTTMTNTTNTNSQRPKGVTLTKLAASYAAYNPQPIPGPGMILTGEYTRIVITVGGDRWVGRGYLADDAPGTAPYRLSIHNGSVRVWLDNDPREMKGFADLPRHQQDQD